MNRRFFAGFRGCARGQSPPRSMITDIKSLKSF